MSQESKYYLSGNTRTDVKAIAKELLWSGIHPTGAKIREIIGSGPSQTTLLAALKEFYQEHGEYLRSENHLPPEVRDACEMITTYMTQKDPTKPE